MKGIYIN